MKRWMAFSASLLLLGNSSFIDISAQAPKTQRTRPAAAHSDPSVGVWPSEKRQELLAKTQQIKLAPDLSQLGAGERACVDKLLEVGLIFQRLYEKQRHKQAIAQFELLKQRENRPANNAEELLTLYRLFQGPIATTLENKREPFLAVEPAPPGKNLYPWGVTKQEIDDFLKAHPEQSDKLLHERTVVRRATRDDVQRDLATLKKYPVLDGLHHGLKQELTRLALKDDAQRFYAVPYAVAFGEELVAAFNLLNEAADLVQKDDEEFAKYLRNRARDLISNDYESGDAAWVTSNFKNLNAQIGSYEVYDDELFGVKTFFAFSVMMVRPNETTALRKALKGLQVLEDSLPHQPHKRVREEIPVGVYDVIADFGQARGGNTATILPNETYLARRYGRTILLRANIMRNPDIFSGTSTRWQASVAPTHKDDLTSDGSFYRTLWHELGHYLGVDRTKGGVDLNDALQENASVYEEMKADLVSLYVAQALHKSGYYNDQQLRAIYASGVLRVLQNNKPRRDQPYNTMQLMQWNYFLENGLLSYDAQTQRLKIDYGRYHDVIAKMLKQVLELQYQGDRAASDRFIDQYFRWDDNLHAVVAKNIREQQKYRYQLFKYAALND